MVKIVEVDDQPDTDRDEECCEIDAAEFAKKVNLKETDDVILVAAKGKMVKVELDQPEDDTTKTSNGYGGGGHCLRIRSSITPYKQHESITGGSMDNPYKIDEDEQTLLQMGTDEDRFALEKCSPKLGADDHNNGKYIQGDKDERRSDTTEVAPDKIVVKREPNDQDGVEGVDDEAYDYCLEITGLSHELPPKRRVFDEEDVEDVVVVEKEAP